MGVDLTLLIVGNDSLSIRDGKWWANCHTQLSLGRQSLCWEAIDALKPQPVPPGSDIASYVARRKSGDEGYGKLDRTPYGDPYTWVEAKPLADAMRRFPPQAADVAYLDKLPPDTKIILHWH